VAEVGGEALNKIGLVYGSSAGCTRQLAGMIAAEFGNRAVEVHDVAEVAPEVFERYESLILGTSTLGCGELQDDWERFRSEFLALDLRGKRVALFGLGDQSDFCNTFVDGLGTLHAMAVDTGAEIVGHWDAVGDYEFGKSAAVVDGRFVGLVIDEENQSELTAGRVRRWVAQLKTELKPPGRVARSSRARAGAKRPRVSTSGSKKSGSPVRDSG
jgi:flavodoxin I